MRLSTGDKTQYKNTCPYHAPDLPLFDNLLPLPFTFFILSGDTFHYQKLFFTHCKPTVNQTQILSIIIHCLPLMMSVKVIFLTIKRGCFGNYFHEKNFIKNLQKSKTSKKSTRQTKAPKTWIIFS